MRRLLAVAALAAAGCIPDPGPMMAPGQDCMECHGGGGGEVDAVPWTVAGTWNGQGAHTWGGTGLHVQIQDANGKRFTIRTNQAGNFYTREGVTFPLTVAVDGRPMPGQVTYGGCNSCHGYGSGGGGDGGGG